MIRVARRAAAAILLAFALTLPAGASVSGALAATPSPSPTAPTSKVVVYSGTGVTTNPSHPGYAAHAETLPSTATVDCTSIPCTIVSIVTDTTSGNTIYDLTDGQKVPFVGGRVSVHIAGHADAVCVDGEVPPGVFGAKAAGDTVTVTYAFGGQSEQTCADGSTAGSPDGYIWTAVLTATSGTPCLATGTCPTPTAAPTGSAVAATQSGRSTPPAADQPSVLSTLPTVVQAFTVPNLLWAVGGTVVLVLLIAFPSYLLDSASDAGLERFDTWRSRRRSRTAAAAAAAAQPVRTGIAWRTLPLAAIGVIAASVISSFIDPAFGFSPAGVRVFLSFLLSFLVDAVAAWFLVLWFMRRTDPTTSASFRFAPASLIVVLVAVLFTRLTGFQPGIVFGLVAGVAFGAVLADSVRARIALLGLGYSFVLGLAGWLGYSALAGAAHGHPSALLVFAQELLAAMAIGGIAALPISLIPVRGLLGGEIFAWSKGVWAAVYALGLLAFFVVLMPKPFSWATVGLSVWVWGGLFAAYAVGAVALWLVIATPWKREPPIDEHDGAEPSA